MAEKPPAKMGMAWSAGGPLHLNTGRMPARTILLLSMRQTPTHIQYTLCMYSYSQHSRPQCSDTPSPHQPCVLMERGLKIRKINGSPVPHSSARGQIITARVRDTRLLCAELCTSPELVVCHTNEARSDRGFIVVKYCRSGRTRRWGVEAVVDFHGDVGVFKLDNAVHAPGVQSVS